MEAALQAQAPSPSRSRRDGPFASGSSGTPGLLGDAQHPRGAAPAPRQRLQDRALPSRILVPPSPPGTAHSHQPCAGQSPRSQQGFVAEAPPQGRDTEPGHRVGTSP